MDRTPPAHCCQRCGAPLWWGVSSEVVLHLMGHDSDGRAIRTEAGRGACPAPVVLKLGR